MLTTLNPTLKVAGARYLRLLVSASYPVNSEAGERTTQWFWRGPNTDWSSERTRVLPIRRDSEAHTYWTILNAGEAGDGHGSPSRPRQWQHRRYDPLDNYQFDRQVTYPLILASNL